MRLPPSAQQMATEPIAIAQTTKAMGAYTPADAARSEGTAKIPAPIRQLMMEAASPREVMTRTRP